MSVKREFKYYPEDFGDLTVKVKHMDLLFDVFEKHTRVESALHITVLKKIKELDLNAKSLEILKVQVDGEDVEYEYLEDEDLLRVKFGREVVSGEDLVIFTETVCKPTANILEGLYYDETPKGCPCQQITQCQQWGFQRIVPCIDDMTAKCTYSTTIIGDERYTNMISNGDVVVERTAFEPGREKIVYDNKVTPMATYLFFLGLGTYATFEREFEYPEGDKFMLELLVPPNSDEEVAMKALSVLHDAIMWVYLFTGRDKFENWERALEIKKMVEEREVLKAAGEDLVSIRQELKTAAAGLHWGYKYTGTVYREIGMQNSDFGGMENVGNTTITTNRIMPFPEMTDGSFEYMIRVKVHEYYHNLNGSEVTGRSPFEIWLNEAVTVFIEQEYHEFIFGRDYARLDTVLTLLAPKGGTFAGDDNAAAMPIEPDGFNDPNELITGVTYVKAPEFVGMIEALMGEKTFVKGLDLYHTRYAHGNASRAQWIEAMEEASGQDFQRMAQVWLKQKSYPKVYVEREYDEGARRLVLKLEQKGFSAGMHWEFPFKVAVCDDEGKDLAERMVRINHAKEEVVFEDVDKPAFISVNRDYACFGKFFYGVSDEELYLQVRKDQDLINRFMAFYRLAEREKMKILEKRGTVSEEFIDLYYELLNDSELMASVSSQMLALFEAVEDEKFAHAYQELYDAVKLIRKSIAEKYADDLLRLYNEYSAMEFDGPYAEREAKAMKARMVKNTCLGLLSELDGEEQWKLIRTQYESAQCATDRVVAFSLYINSAAPDKMDLLREYQAVAEKSLVSWESFLASVARNDSEDYLDVIRAVESSDNFRIEQANDQRALYAAFAGNRKKSLLTEEGRGFLKEALLKLAPINEYTSLYLLKVFGNMDQMAEKHQAPLVGLLMEVQKELADKKLPSVLNTIERILKGNPKSVERWEARG